ncbi:DNA polymerase III subunit gamma/tau [bacterium SCSIO 12643]|nr:DNA polymerase III subunit gamma/tau [bacterium SCSIO 12643]
MENFIVSARKYRPTTWESVVGQKAITETLKSAIENNHLAQAFLLTGPRGVGKTTTARILAKTINRNDLDQEVNEDEDFAFNIFELDAASNNTVEDIRQLIDQVRIPPQIGSHKVYIIDEVHMLSSAAFNAFLKTLEEPPEHAIFILATTEKHKVIPTIISRCQVFDFQRINNSDIVGHLHYIAKQESISAEDDALHTIAQKADGGMRDALSIFDQIVSFSGNTITYKNVIENLNILDFEFYFKVTDLILEQNASGALLLFNQVLEKGFDGHNFIVGIASHFRDLLVASNPQTLSLLETSENLKERYLSQAGKCNPEFLLDALQLLSDVDFRYKTSKNQRLLVEVCLMQLSSIGVGSEKKN